MKLGYDYQYPIFGKSLKMKDVLYVPGLKKNLLSILALNAKGIRVAFVDGQVLMCPKEKIIDDATVFGEEYKGLYNIKAHPKQELVHESIEPSKLWHIRLTHVHYRALPMASKAVSRLPEI